MSDVEDLRQLHACEQFLARVDQALGLASRLELPDTPERRALVRAVATAKAAAPVIQEQMRALRARIALRHAGTVQ
jgi:hypothetical protein